MRFKSILKAPLKAVAFPVKLIQKGVDKTMQAVVMGVARHLLTAGGGYLVAHGLATGDSTTDAVGAVITLIGFIWSVVSKRKK